MKSVNVRDRSCMQDNYRNKEKWINSKYIVQTKFLKKHSFETLLQKSRNCVVANLLHISWHLAIFPTKCRISSSFVEWEMHRKRFHNTLQAMMVKDLNANINKVNTHYPKVTMIGALILFVRNKRVSLMHNKVGHMLHKGGTTYEVIIFLFGRDLMPCIRCFHNYFSSLVPYAIDV